MQARKLLCGQPAEFHRSYVFCSVHGPCYPVLHARDPGSIPIHRIHDIPNCVPLRNITPNGDTKVDDNMYIILYASIYIPPDICASQIPGRLEHAGDWLNASSITSCVVVVVVDESVRHSSSSCGRRSSNRASVVSRPSSFVVVDRRRRRRRRRAGWDQVDRFVVVVLNVVLCRSFVSVGIPSMKEPSRLDRIVEKRPVGMTVVPCMSSSSSRLSWVITVVRHEGSVVRTSVCSSSSGAVSQKRQSERKMRSYEFVVVVTRRRRSCRHSNHWARSVVRRSIVVVVVGRRIATQTLDRCRRQ